MTDPDKPDIPTKLMPSAYTPKVALGLDENVAATLCYALCWVSAVVFLIIEKKNRIVRFHAWQSFAVFLPLHVLITLFFFTRALVDNAVLRFGLMFLGGMISLLMVAFWLKLLLAAWQEDDYRAPLVGRAIVSRVLRVEDTMRRKK